VCFFGCCAFGKQEKNKEKADKILIEKGNRRLALLSKGKEIRVYTISLGRNPKGPKTKQGDKKTPEGIYKIISRNRHSRYHLALKISYPNNKDLQRAKKHKLNPGGDIMIHGIKNGLGWLGRLHRLIDWTQGCIAVTNKEMEEIWDLVPIGTPVEIRP
jgi:murein L,D-transpeptidase YafK